MAALAPPLGDEAVLPALNSNAGYAHGIETSTADQHDVKTSATTPIETDEKSTTTPTDEKAAMPIDDEKRGLPTGSPDGLSLEHSGGERQLYDHRLTVVENKSLLINQAMAEMGMGRYQWCIWVLCGFGYFLDLLWSKSYGLMLSPLQKELYIPDGQIGNISVSMSVGLTVGALTWGILVDVIGRRWCFNYTALITAVFGLLFGVQSNWNVLCFFTAMVGFGIGGNIPIDATIVLEFLPKNRRFLLTTLSLFQPLGVIFSTLFAYGIVPQRTCPTQAGCTKENNMGWRYLSYTIGAITLGIFILRFFIFHFHESPKYLLNRGRDAEAIEVVHAIAKFNRAPVPQVSMADFAAIEAAAQQHASFGSIEKHSFDYVNDISTAPAPPMPGKPGEKIAMLAMLKNVRGLFATRTSTRITLLLWLIFICDFWGFTIAGTYLPIILVKVAGVQNKTVLETYAGYCIVYTPGILGVIVGTALTQVPRLGRQYAMVFASAMMGVSMFCYSQAGSWAGSIGLNTMEYFFQSMFNAILYGFIPEVYNSANRGAGCGIASMWGRLFGIIAPYAAGRLYAAGTLEAARYTLYLGGGVVLICPFALALLPFDTKTREAL